MPPKKLTNSQRNRLKRLELELRRAVRFGDYSAAKRLAGDIQNVLRPTGHVTRLMQAKNWLFEAALEAGKLQIAIAGFIGVRQQVARSTRIYLEATALLAICYLRRGEVAQAEPLIADVLRNEAVISSERRRRQFRLRIIQRFEEEAALAALSGGTIQPLNVDEVQSEAGRLLQTQTEDEMYAKVGAEVPPEVISILIRVHEFSRRQLSPGTVRLLPPPRSLEEKSALGRTITEATKRVVWRSLCDPKNVVYKAWCTNGLMGILDKKVLVIALVSLLAGMQIGAFTLAASVAALIFRMGLDVFCEMAKPAGVMIGLREKD